MDKKEVLKRMGQIYALALQQNYTPEQVISHLNHHFAFLYNGGKQKMYRSEESMEGSLQNRLAEMGHDPERMNIEVGMGATETMYSDCHPYTVIEIIRFKSGEKKGKIKGVVLQADNYEKVADYDYFANQHYTYTPNPDGHTVEATFRKDGTLKSTTGRTYALGFRRQYQDPHF
jgi:hypothetical protein